MLEISVIGAKPKHLINDRGKVGKRADHPQPRRPVWSFAALAGYCQEPFRVNGIAG